MTHVHTIPVPKGQQPMEAWLELCFFGHRVTPGPIVGWANIDCDGRECRGIEHVDVDP